jgi:hypothetical protein
MMLRLALCLTALAAAGPAHAGDASAPASGRPSAVLLLVATTPDGTVATFGQSGADGGAAGGALARELEALGFRLRSAAGQTVAVTGEGNSSLLPVGDQAALDLARKVGAAAAWVVGINVKADGVIRGTRLLGAAGRGQVRLLDVQSGNTVASAEIDGAGYDGALDRAAAAAARDVAERLVREVEPEAARRWPSGSSGGAAIAVEVRGARRWSSIAAIIQRLGTTEGVLAVHAREVRRGRVVLGVETRLAAAKVAAAVERARLPSGTARASARNDSQVTAEIRGESSAPGPGAQD